MIENQKSIYGYGENAGSYDVIAKAKCMEKRQF